MLFANWLSTYLNELQLPATLSGYSWTIAEVITGWIADRTSHATALMIIMGNQGLINAITATI